MALEALAVRQLKKTEVYRDLARIPEAYRRDTLGRPIKEGTICRVTVSTHQGTAILSLRGLIGETERIIRMDEITRNQLGVAFDSSHHFEFTPVSLLGVAVWRWNASDPAQRKTNRMAMIGFGLTMIGLTIAIARLIWG